MKYPTKLIIRLAIALIIFLIPFNFFNFLFSKITVYPSFLILLIKYSNTILENSSIVINDQTLKLIPACIATSAYYFLLLLILLTKDIKFRTRIYIFLLGSLLILILNIIRIDILIYTFLEYEINLFRAVHLFFWEFVSGIYVAIVWIFLVWKFKIKGIPIYSDLKYLLKSIKK